MLVPFFGSKNLIGLGFGPIQSEATSSAGVVNLWAKFMARDKV